MVEPVILRDLVCPACRNRPCACFSLARPGDVLRDAVLGTGTGSAISRRFLRRVGQAQEASGELERWAVREGFASDQPGITYVIEALDDGGWNCFAAFIEGAAA